MELAAEVLILRAEERNTLLLFAQLQTTKKTVCHVSMASMVCHAADSSSVGVHGLEC